MRPCELSQNQLARCIGVSPRRINEIVLGRRSITAESAVLLGEFFSIDPRYWMTLQADYDVEIALASRKPRKVLPGFVPVELPEDSAHNRHVTALLREVLRKERGTKRRSQRRMPRWAGLE